MTHINQRRDTAANWIVVDPILQEGEVGWETDTLRSKLGNGVDVWSALDYNLDTAGLAPLDSPVFTGNPQVPTVASSDSDTTAASTAFVHSLTEPLGELIDLKADIESPSFTGDPTVPTPDSIDDSQSVANTEWVNAAIDAGLIGATTVPSGTIASFAGTAAPAGWYIANGDEKNRIADAALFAVIGTTFGAGDGVNTFNLPNLEGRSIFGIDPLDDAFDIRGLLGGAQNHTHPLSEAGWARIYVSGSNGDTEMDYTPTANWTSDRAAATTLQTPHTPQSMPGGAVLDGATDQGSNLPPYIALHYIIKA